MKNHTQWLWSGLLWLMPLLLPAQIYDIAFQSGIIGASAMNLPAAENESVFSASEYQGNYYLVMQFEQIPDSSTRQSLAAAGIELFDYIPNYAYLAKVPIGLSFSEIAARAIAVYEGQYKLSAALATGNYPSHAYHEGVLSLIVKPWPSVAADSLAVDLSAVGYAPTVTTEGKLRIELPSSELSTLASHPGIQHLSVIEAEPKKEGWIGRASHRVNRFGPGPGLHYDGTGVSGAIADDGKANHIDKKGRLIDLTGGLDYGSHADMTTGLFIGAGNLHPDYRGFAPGATLRLYFISNYPHISNAIQNYLNHGTIITSTSFGEGCGGRYTPTAQMIDDQVYMRPELLHFFSAGNSGNDNCSSIYGAYNYGNITGGRKAAKNVFAVANLFFDDNRVSSSSRGPAEDGRTKPDISGFGQGILTTGPNNSLMTGSGTSAAAPSVAGTAALLVEAYRDLNTQQDPTADIIKSIMLNTAEDLGRKGPDFDFGWGRVHAGRALECLQQGQFVRNTISQNGAQDFNISVPSNTAQVNIMLYWTDAKGSPVAAKALVNDLDLEVYGPGGNIHLPWKLSTVAHPDSLTKPAYSGRDHINNMEQVSISTPVAGTYTIHVSSYILPSSAQDYVVTYSFIKNEIDVVYPHDNAALAPGEDAVIRWDAISNSGSFIVEYAVGSGPWTTISSTVPGSRRHLDWTVPNIASANVRVRVRRGNLSDTSDGTFTVLGVPQIQAETAVSSSVKISWAPIPGADEYQVFKLGDQYMEPVQTTAASSLTLSAQPGQRHWYAVRARIDGQSPGKRSLAVSHTAYDCEETVQIVLNFDLFPAETSWSIQNQNGDTIVSGGPYDNQAPQSSKQIDVCLPYGCFNFTMYDSHNDGMCCDHGNGSYQILNPNGDVLISGGSFSGQETKVFCVEDIDPEPITVTVTNQQDVSCHGYADGSLTVSATGGNGNYSYLWSDGSTSPARNNLPAGNYTVTVSDGTAQTARTATIVQPDPITINLISTPPSCISNNNGNIYATVTEGAESLYSFAWSNGASSSSINGLSAGIYTVTVTNSNGCSATQSSTLNPPSPISAQISTSPASCPQSSDGSISVHNISGGSGDYAVLWSNGATTTSISNLSPGNYSVTISDGSNCQANAMASVTAGSGPQLSFTNIIPSCQDGNTGKATAVGSGGQGPYTYSWSNGANTATITALAEGSYTVTLTDANGCTTSKSALIEAAPNISVDINTDVQACVSEGNASVIAFPSGGVPPYTFAWSMGATTSSVFGLQSGSYSVTVTDSNGCSGTADASIAPSSPINLSFTSVPPSCAGINDGSLAVTATNGQPPYTYSWSNGQSGSSLDNIAAGIYTVTVTDATDCQREESLSLIAPAPLQASLEVENATCQLANDGAIAIFLSGGTGGYDVQWSNGATGNSLSGLAMGTYSVTATDDNGCSFSTAASVQEESPLSIVLTAENVSCYDAADGQIVAETSGGSGAAATFTWNTGEQESVISGLPVGSYSLTVTDDAGCQASSAVVVSQPQPIVIEVNTSDVINDELGSATANTYGGTPPYSYVWSSGAIDSSVNGLGAGAYSLTVTDANSCMATRDFIIEDPMIEVCNSRGNSTQYEWIDSIAFSGFSHHSGNNAGYADFREDSSLWIHLDPTVTQDITLVPGFNGSPFNEHWRVWVDFDQDGIFNDATEQVFAPLASGQATQGVLALPDSIPEGAYAMRIAMRYGSPPQACQAFPYGEVEDYLVVVERTPEYCPSSALSSSSEWIEAVAFDGQTFNSGNDGGYGDYTDSLLTFNAGDTVQFELTPGFSLNAAPENWQLFIDLDGDGSFMVEEERVHVRNGHPFSYSDSFIIPVGAAPGSRLLRVVMNFGEEAPPCGSYIWGETEDYTVKILPATGGTSGENSAITFFSGDAEADSPSRGSELLAVYPNPFQERIFADLYMPEDGLLHYRLYNGTGQLLEQQQLQLAAGQQQLDIPMNRFPNGTYWLMIQVEGRQWKRVLIKQ